MHKNGAWGAFALINVPLGARVMDQGKGQAMDQKSDPIGTVVKGVAFVADKHRARRSKDADASPYISLPIPLVNVEANEGDRARNQR